jgi:organic hydroperoxide reductase OsmC/OhrA
MQEREVLVQKLDQSVPGQLGKVSRRMADAGVNIEVLYSDHENQLILAVDDIAKGRAVSEAWTHERAAKKSDTVGKQHTYEVRVDWTGNDGEGTRTYRGYRRDHTITSKGKPQIPASSDPSFRGDPSRYNPEELLVASLSSCHMLWYLHLCSVNHVTVLDYSDTASGVMQEGKDGSGEFVGVTLRPTVKISAGNDEVRARARALHEEAHRLCFIARSVNFPVDVIPEIVEAAAPK